MYPALCLYAHSFNRLRFSIIFFFFIMKMEPYQTIARAILFMHRSTNIRSAILIRVFFPSSSHELKWGFSYG